MSGNKRAEETHDACRQSIVGQGEIHLHNPLLIQNYIISIFPGICNECGVMWHLFFKQHQQEQSDLTPDVIRNTTSDHPPNILWRIQGHSTRRNDHKSDRKLAPTDPSSCFALLQYIPRNMHTVFALLCFVVVIHWLIFPYPSGLLHWHCGNLTIAPVPAKQPWWLWINTSCAFIMNDYITTTKQSTTKPCAYFLGYTVC